MFFWPIFEPSHLLDRSFSKINPFFESSIFIEFFYAGLFSYDVLKAHTKLCQDPNILK
jgi:hypothetical protein